MLKKKLMFGKYQMYIFIFITFLFAVPQQQFSMMPPGAGPVQNFMTHPQQNVGFQSFDPVSI